MAALILGAGALAYDQVQKGRAKRKARKDFNTQRFSELERENTERIGGLQRDDNTCFCDREGRECALHDCAGGDGVAGRRSEEGPPAYVNVTGQRGYEREVEGEGEGGSVGRAPETEVERLRINEERRKIMRRDKGYKRLFGRKKRGQEMVAT